MKNSIMNKFREWLIADYEQRLGHVSKSTVNHRITQINFLLTKPASQYNCFDRKCLGHSINKFLEFYVKTTLNGDENSEFINMMNNISANINK